MAPAPAPSEIHALAAVTAAAVLAACYARLAAGALRTGLPRVVALFPVAGLLVALPLAFSTVHFRTISAFFLTWLGSFKILLLAAGRGPLAAPLPLPRFVACALLPLKLHDPAARSRYSVPPALVASFAVKMALLSVVISFYGARTSPVAALALYCLHCYLSLESVLNLTAIAAIALLGLELEPQFDKPYFASSLRDFWGRRWNLMVTSILRPSVYLPVRAALGREAAVLATFAVSGAMHELIFYYITFRAPSWEVTAFFLLQGVSVIAEGWAAKSVAWRPPRVVATAGVLGYVAATGYWLFFPPVVNTDAFVVAVGEAEAIFAFVRTAFGRMAAAIGLGGFAV